MSEDNGELKRGSVIQVKPEVDGWGGCIMIVDEVKDFGCQAYMRVPKSGDAFIRLKDDQYEQIMGLAAYCRGDKA